MNSRPSLPIKVSILVSALLTFITPAIGFTLEEALDAPAVTWQATSAWEGLATASARDGVLAAQGTATANGYDQRLSTTITGPGTFSLWWQVTAGGNDGSLIFEVDGKSVLTRSPQPFSWEQVAVNVPVGAHTLAVILNHGTADLTAMLDQAVWTGLKLPAAAALGDPDGFWVQTKEWRQTAAAARNGTGDAASLQYSGGAGNFRLVRLMSAPAVIRYWRKIETATPELYSDSSGHSLPLSWAQTTVLDEGQISQSGLLDLSFTAKDGAAPATVWLDDLEITPLSLAAAVDLSPASPVFSVSAGSKPWTAITDEADLRRTGSIEVRPGIANAFADMRTSFNGEGLLTWSWRKSLLPADTLTVSSNGTLLGFLDSQSDNTGGFSHQSLVLTNPGVNSVLWHLKWGANGLNPMALDDVLFSSPAPPGIREAIEVNSFNPLYVTPGTPWTSQTLVTHDDTDALELAVAGNGSRAALTMPVFGPGILTWWWRSDLPEDAAFRLHRQGHAVRTLKGTSGWRQEFLPVRNDQEFVRWEFFPGSTPASTFHRVWLDEVTLVPQDISIAEAVDTPDRSWIYSGDVLAANLATPLSHDGTDALVLTGRTNGSTSTVRTSLTGPGILTFWVKVLLGPSEASHHPEMVLDGTPQWLDLTPGSDGWRAFSFTLSTGTHPVDWNVDRGAVMILDEVRFTPVDGYTLWAQSSISPGRPAGPNDDPDGDGVPNFLEYAFNTLPLDPGSAGHPSIRTLTTGKNVIEFVINNFADLTWAAEVSVDLTSWDTVPATIVSDSGLMRTIQAELPDGQPFARVRVTK